MFKLEHEWKPFVVAKLNWTVQKKSVWKKSYKHNLAHRTGIYDKIFYGDQ